MAAAGPQAGMERKRRIDEAEATDGGASSVAVNAPCAKAGGEESEAEHAKVGKKRGGSTPAMTWAQRVRLEPGWVTDKEEDPWIGERIREAYGIYTTAEKGETCRRVSAAKSVDLKELVKLNQRRWYPGLDSRSVLAPGTRLFLPRGGSTEDFFCEGEIVATNAQWLQWHVRYDDGDEADLEADEVASARWNYRIVDEGWKVKEDENEMLGKYVRRAFGYGFAKGRVVAYLPPGDDADEEPEMWHVIHDHDGDHEDLEKHELDEALASWENYRTQEMARQKRREDALMLEGPVGKNPDGPVEVPAGYHLILDYAAGEDVLCDKDGMVYAAKILKVQPEPGASPSPSPKTKHKKKKVAAAQEQFVENGEEQDVNGDIHLPGDNEEANVDGEKEKEEDSAEEDGQRSTYYIHYQGWKKRFDEWVGPEYLYKVGDVQGLRRLEDQKNASKRALSGKKEMKIQIPAGLQERLTAEFTLIRTEERLLTLPRAPNVNSIIQQWVYRADPLAGGEDAGGENYYFDDDGENFPKWWLEFFEKALPHVLLYDEERWQHAEIAEAQTISEMKMRTADIYGAEHLLRLLGRKLPMLVADTDADNDTLKSIKKHTESLLQFMDDQSLIFFAGAGYQNLEQRISNEPPTELPGTTERLFTDQSGVLSPRGGARDDDAGLKGSPPTKKPNKRTWTSEEDAALIKLIRADGATQWEAKAKAMHEQGFTLRSSGSLDQRWRSKLSHRLGHQ